MIEPGGPIMSGLPPVATVGADIPAQQRRAKGGPVGERGRAGVQAGPTRGEIDEKPRSNYRCMIVLYRDSGAPALGGDCYNPSDVTS
jgi:hypothetical protein